ncbi:MAG TPA: hypothetical protein IAA98_00880 [Candidatus Avipropionibacterium avicola]|uniref:Uncharacterized protein n=1 Tax=Candidatus Avipropionibacterium avicola TaxID=2840701 RepID=A0A9D1GVS1_9ACTN|nr:hypothetical protein [Candidatus Avipropionibacterium avicola]
MNQPDQATSTDSDTPEEHPEVAAALSRLDELDERPVDDHAEILASVHERLHTTLNEHRSNETPNTENPSGEYA